MFCPKCGVQVEDAWNLCPKCGAKLRVTPPPKKKTATSEEVREALVIWAAPVAVSVIGFALYRIVISLFSTALLRIDGIYPPDVAGNFARILLPIVAALALLTALRGKKHSPLPAVAGGALAFLASLSFILWTYRFFADYDYGGSRSGVDYNAVVLSYLGLGLLIGLLVSLLIGLLARPKNLLIPLGVAAILHGPALLLILIERFTGLPNFLVAITMVFSGISLSLSLLLPAFSRALPARRR